MFWPYSALVIPSCNTMFSSSPKLTNNKQTKQTYKKTLAKLTMLIRKHLR